MPDSTLPYNEPGATDNRLSLNPSQFEGMADWQDGETYEMTVRVRQVSQGEFEVLDATPSEAEPEEEPGMKEPQASENEGAEPESNYPNPAVAKMMKGRKSGMGGMGGSMMD